MGRRPGAPARTANFGLPLISAAHAGSTREHTPRFLHPPPYLPPRAISSPKVTRRFCRLPLAIFWDLAKESSSRRPAAVMCTATESLGRAPKRGPAQASQFSREEGSDIHGAKKRAASCGAVSCFADQIDSTGHPVGKNPSNRTENSADVTPARPGCPPRHRAHRYSGTGTLTRFPFGPKVAGTASAAASFIHVLRTDLPAAECPSRGTILLLSPEDSHLSFNYSYQDLH